MRWFRTNRRLSGTLALLALALQVTLAFGHVHVRDVAGASGAAFSKSRANVNQTSGHNTGHATDDFCLICANIIVASTAMPPSRVALSLPVNSTKTSYGHFRSASYSRFEHAPFHARAPPLASIHRPSAFRIVAI
jgi:hypothetical protein